MKLFSPHSAIQSNPVAKTKYNLVVAEQEYKELYDKVVAKDQLFNDLLFGDDYKTYDAVYDAAEKSWLELCDSWKGKCFIIDRFYFSRTYKKI